MRFFKWVSGQKKCSHEIRRYPSLIELPIVLGDLDKLILVFDDLKGQGFVMTVFFSS